MMDNRYRQEDKQFQEKVVKIRRVSKKTTGGNYVTNTWFFFLY
jgi:ribosomal protein S5